MKRFNLSEWAVTHRAMVLFLIVAILLAGVVSFLRLGRLEDPSFTVPSMTVVVVWPGATAQELQDQVLNRIEQKVQELGSLDNVRTYSRQGYGAITLWMKGGTSSKELEEAWYQARKKIGDIRASFPEGVQGPFYNDEYTDLYSVLYAVGGEGMQMSELLTMAEDVKRRLQTVEGTNKVDILGQQPEQVFVEVSTRRLAALGIAPGTVVDALAKQGLVVPSGSVDTSVDRVHVRVSGALRNINDVGDVRIESGGHVLRLADIASVKAGYKDPASYTIRENGQPVLAVGVTMVKNGNVLDLGKALDKKMAGIQASLPAGVTIEKYADQPKLVAESVWEFERSFLEALAIVLGVSFLFLGWRTGIVVAATVPLVLSMVAIVMYIMGWNLDRISLGALIIALGLLVDDAIIAVEMMVVKLEEGWDRVKAATFAYTSTAFPMLTGTLVTVAGFMPVGFAKSIAGEYAGGIFWVVGVALIASWFVAVVFTPYLGVKLLPKNLVHVDERHNPYASPRYRRWQAVIDWSVQHRRLVVIATVVAFGVAGAGMGLVQQQFFPTASRVELLVDLRMREGSSFAATQAQVVRLESILKADKDVSSFTAYTGAGSPRFYIAQQPELPSPSYAQLVVLTPDIPARERVKTRMQALFDKNEQFPDARPRVLRLDIGPPVGFPVQVRVMGPDPLKVRSIAYKVRDIMRTSPLVRDTQLDWNEQVRRVGVDVDQDKVKLLGLTSTDVQRVVQAAVSGIPVTQIRKGEHVVDVVLRSTAKERKDLSSLDDIQLFTPAGLTVPLSQVAHIKHDYDEPVLWRRNRELALTVRADLPDGVQGPYATGKIMPMLKPVVDSLPPGYHLEAGGAVEESEKANLAIFAVFPLMFLVMLTFLMLQLQSFSKMFLVFMTFPLGVIGVVPALLIFRAPFGFVALLGVIALGGMIMRNSVILVDQIDQNVKAGADPWTAIVEATVKRTRPVVLTAAAAILAMIPLVDSVFWGPMAISIMGGLIVATALTLIFVPALYALWFKVKRDAAGVAPEAAEAV